MKVLTEKVMKTGIRRVTIDLYPNEKLCAFKEDDFYKTGYPLEEIINGHHILDSVRVTWCAFEQRWIE